MYNDGMQYLIIIMRVCEYGNAILRYDTNSRR